MNDHGQNMGSPGTAQLLGGQLLSSHLLPSNRIGEGGSRPVAPARTGEVPVPLGDPGGCPPTGSTVYVVLDQSPSVASEGGNDPLSRRHQETALAIAQVASACRCRQDRVGLIPFSVGSPGHVPPQPLARPGMRRLRRGLRAGCGSSSSMLPALRFVERDARDRRGPLALVVFSDFLLTDSSPSDVISRMCAFPGSVHAVVLGAAPPQALLRHPHVTVTRLTPNSPRGAAAQAVFDGLTRHRTHH